MYPVHWLSRDATDLRPAHCDACRNEHGGRRSRLGTVTSRSRGGGRDGQHAEEMTGRGRKQEMGQEGMGAGPRTPRGSEAAIMLLAAFSPSPAPPNAAFLGTGRLSGAGPLSRCGRCLFGGQGSKTEGGANLVADHPPIAPTRPAPNPIDLRSLVLLRRRCATQPTAAPPAAYATGRWEDLISGPRGFPPAAARKAASRRRRYRMGHTQNLIRTFLRQTQPCQASFCATADPIETQPCWFTIAVGKKRLE